MVCRLDLLLLKDSFLCPSVRYNSRLAEHLEGLISFDLKAEIIPKVTSLKSEVKSLHAELKLIRSVIKSDVSIVIQQNCMAIIPSDATHCVCRWLQGRTEKLKRRERGETEGG